MKNTNYGNVWLILCDICVKKKNTFCILYHSTGIYELSQMLNDCSSFTVIYPPPHIPVHYACHHVTFILVTVCRVCYMPRPNRRLTVKIVGP